MKKLITIILVSLLTVTLAHAQEKQDQMNDPRVGIAVNLSTFSVSGLETSGMITTGNTVSLPLNLGKKFRLEPELSALIHTEDFEFNSRNEKYISFGLGMFLRNRNEEINVLYGIRAGGMNIDGDMGIYITPAIGAEYYLSGRFCLRGEFQVNNMIIGRIRTTAIQTPVSLIFFLK
jgi:hypothetical protein